jgi:hypothetical protein
MRKTFGEKLSSIENDFTVSASGIELPPLAKDGTMPLSCHPGHLITHFPSCTSSPTTAG